MTLVLVIASGRGSVRMPRLRGELESCVAMVPAGCTPPPPTFPLQVFAPGQAQDPEDRCFFHFLERHVSVEATRVMPLRGAWTWLWPRSKGGGVFQPKLSVASTPYSGPPTKVRGRELQRRQAR